jgi:transcription initiation factor TFIIIB Brf1 subunit/transcription initiation factor TFIIB
MRKMERQKKKGLSNYGLAFAGPFRLSPLGRKQVGVTPAVEKYVHGFRAKGLKGLGIAKAIIKDTHNFGKVALPKEEAVKVWGKRSAGEIIASRTVFINKELAVAGCTDRAIVITASLRAAGFKAMIVNTDRHTYVKMLYRNKIWIVNTLATQTSGIREMTEKDKKFEDNRRAAKAFAEALSLPQMGINDYGDTAKFLYRKRH